MNPAKEFCPNTNCPDRGKIGGGNIGVHSQKEQRCICRTCDKTFSHTHGSAVYGIKKAHELFWIVVTLLAFGCPTQAIVAAFGLDERTVRSWMQKSGEHCQGVHEHFMEQTDLDLEHVQADEIKIKQQGGTLWMALAIMVSTRLWLGGAVSEKRDKSLIRHLAGQLASWALCRPILLAVDGFSAYPKAFVQAFRSPFKGEKGGRPRLLEWANVNIVQVVKQRTTGTFSVTRRVKQGCPQQIWELIERSQGDGTINTAYIERLNATFRQRLAPLVRRTRNLARLPQTLSCGMYLVGCVYNFCTEHHSLCLPLYVGEHGLRWVQRTPALAAGLSDHCWTVEELLSFKIAPDPYQPPKKRGRPRKQAILEAST
jgi:transposase-like protein